TRTDGYSGRRLHRLAGRRGPAGQLALAGGHPPTDVPGAHEAGPQDGGGDDRCTHRPGAERARGEHHGDGQHLGPAGHTQPCPVVADHRPDAGQIEHPTLEARARACEAGRRQDEEAGGRQPGDHDADRPERDGHPAEREESDPAHGYPTRVVTSWAMSTTSSAMTVTASAVYAHRQRWSAAQNRRMVMTLAAMATAPTGRPIAGPTPAASPRAGARNGSTR